MKIINRGLLALLLLFLLTSCEKQQVSLIHEAYLDLPTTPDRYLADTINSNIPTLGRVLFYDARMSINNSISCASCHKQALAFADNVALSDGFEGRLTFRNSMPIQNLKTAFFFGPMGKEGDPIIVPDLNLSLFWDGRETLLDAMVLRPITNHVEMGITDLDVLSQKLGELPEYKDLFQKAYGTSDVDKYKIAKALSEFLASIVSNHSKFDDVGRGQNQFTALEQSGQELFFGKYNCNNCHQTQQFNGYQLGGGFVNIGLDQRYADQGFADVSGLKVDEGKFKIPTLRNVALTAPYMHDGRFKTLDDVLEHYSDGIKDNPNLDPRLRGANNEPSKLEISYHDRQAIIAFLNTLTDYTMVTDPKFSNPFRVPK